MINLLKMGFITTVNISCVQRNRKEKGGTNRREGGREREKGEQGERKGGRKCIMLDDTCVSVVLDRYPCCLPYRWRPYSSAVVSLHSSVWLAHAGYHLTKVEEKRYEQMVGGSL